MKIGVTFGAFDLCHAGHVLMFGECKRHCDYLIVGLQVDPSQERDSKNSPVQSLYERFVQLNAIRFIDEVIPYQFENEIVQIIQSREIDIRFVGDDYIGRDFTGKTYCIDKNIEIYYNKRDHGFSTSELRKRIESSSNR